MKHVLCFAALPSWLLAKLAIKCVKNHPWKTLGGGFRYSLLDWAAGRTELIKGFDMVMWAACAVGGLMVFHFRF